MSARSRFGRKRPTRGRDVVTTLPNDHISRMDVREFREQGYLQEANRRFFHPLGLALEVVCLDDGSECLGGIWDYRDEPEGIYFADAGGGKPSVGDCGAALAAHVDHEIERRAGVRTLLFGAPIQPVEQVEREESA